MQQTGMWELEIHDVARYRISSYLHPRPTQSGVDIELFTLTLQVGALVIMQKFKPPL